MFGLILCFNLSLGDYDYNLLIHDSLLFYEAQRSGKLPADNRIKWRGDSMLADKGDGGEDLTGGYFDAGDLVKFGFPMAYTATVLSWGLIEYEDSYTKAGELENGRKAVKWATDYFLKVQIFLLFIFTNTTLLLFYNQILFCRRIPKKENFTDRWVTEKRIMHIGADLRTGQHPRNDPHIR